MVPMNNTANRPTIGNLPGADVRVQFPSGDVRVVNLVILKAEVLHAETMAKFGHGLARNAPTLREIRAAYEIPTNVSRTWAAVAPLLRRFHTDLSDAARS